MAYLNPINNAATNYPTHHYGVYDDKLINRNMNDYTRQFFNPFYAHLSALEDIERRMESAFSHIDEHFGRVNIPLSGNDDDTVTEPQPKRWLTNWFKKSKALDPLSALRPQPVNMMSSISIDVAETPETYEIQAAVPGYDRPEVKVEVEHDRMGHQYLIIRAQKAQRMNKEDEKHNFVYRESSFASASRSIPLPDNVDFEKGVTAKMEKGQLHITIPKSVERKSKGKPITVQ